MNLELFSRDGFSEAVERAKRGGGQGLGGGAENRHQLLRLQRDDLCEDLKAVCTAWLEIKKNDIEIFFLDSLEGKMRFFCRFDVWPKPSKAIDMARRLGF